MDKRAFLRGLALAGAGACLGAYAFAAEVIVRVAPPPPREERHGPPRHGFVWVGGFWDWNGRRYVWRPGHWERERHGYHWREHRWVERNGGWVHERGGWEH